MDTETERKRTTEAEIERTTASLVDKAHQLEQRVSHAKDRVREVISPREQLRAHPWPSVGIAFGFGFLLGRRI